MYSSRAKGLKILGSCLIHVIYKWSNLRTVYFLLFLPTSVLLPSHGFPTYISSFIRKYLSFSAQWHFDSEHLPEEKRDFRRQLRTALLWAITQGVVVISYWSCGTTYRSHSQGNPEEINPNSFICLVDKPALKSFQVTLTARHFQVNQVLNGPQNSFYCHRGLIVHMKRYCLARVKSYVGLYFRQ